MKTEHSREQLHAAFESVQNKRMWKGPVDAFIRKEERDITSAAIMYFTGTEAEFTQASEDWLRVKADGYWAGPCN